MPLPPADVGPGDGARAWTGRAEPLGQALPGWLTPGRLGLTLFLVVLGWYCLTAGVPIDRIGQTGWILLGLLAAGLGRTWRQHVRVFTDWLPLLAALVVYDHTRGIADSLGTTVRVGELVEVERWLFLGQLPTVWLQDRLYDPAQVAWWESLVALVYFSHFVLPWAIAAVFYLRSRPLWVRYIRRVLLLSYLGLITYIVVPAAPPWFAARDGVIDAEVARVSTRGWGQLGLGIADAWLRSAHAQSNHVAALPSLHAAFSLLVVVALWPALVVAAARGWRRSLALAGRTVLALFPLAMAFSLVYGGEHYVVDVLAGWAYVAAACLLARWWERRAEPRVG